MKIAWINRFTLALLAGLAMGVLIAASPAFAQIPKYDDPVGILAWLKIQAIGVSLVVTLLWKYVPVVKDWSNKAIPWLSLASFVIYQLAGAQGMAQAADALATAVPHRSFWSVLIVSAANSAAAKIAWDGWLKPTIGDWLDAKLGRVPQTPHLGPATTK